MFVLKIFLDWQTVMTCLPWKESVGVIEMTVFALKSIYFGGSGGCLISSADLLLLTSLFLFIFNFFCIDIKITGLEYDKGILNELAESYSRLIKIQIYSDL